MLRSRFDGVLVGDTRGTVVAVVVLCVAMVGRVGCQRGGREGWSRRVCCGAI